MHGHAIIRVAIALTLSACGKVDDAAPKTPPDDEQVDAFTAAAGAWGRSGWTKIELARVPTATLAALVPEAWRLVAPKKLVAAYEDGPTGARKPPPAKKKRG